MIRMFALLCLVAVLAACSSHPAPADTAANSAAPASASTNVLAGTPMATYCHDLNKAKNVQNVVNQAAARQAKAIDAATGSSSP
jgi:hypothetical protein